MKREINYQIIERKPTVDQYFELRKAVKWPIGDEDAYKKGINNSIFAVCAFLGNEIIGSARIVGDDSVCFYIQDVMVKPEYQRMGIGFEMMNKIMNYIKERACPGAFVALMSAKDKEGFYEKFGFWKRPNEKFGHGMMQVWDKKEFNESMFELQ